MPWATFCNFSPVYILSTSQATRGLWIKCQTFGCALLSPGWAGPVFYKITLSFLETVWEMGLGSPLPASACLPLRGAGLPPKPSLAICKICRMIFIPEGCSAVLFVKTCLLCGQKCASYSVNAKCYSLSVNDNRLWFFSYWAKVTGQQAVISKASCGLEALLLSCVISQSSFKFSSNNAFLIHIMGFFLFLCCMTWSKDFVHGFAWCRDTQPSYKQVISRFRW